MTSTISVDLLIFGGGVAGLWTAARLSWAGYACALLESESMGAGQTIASQGILHGGIKYALAGRASRASRAVAAMPAIWFRHLCGETAPDLTDVPVLSQYQYLWPAPDRISRLAAFFASRVLRSHSDKISASMVPMFSAAPPDLSLYRIGERIICPLRLVESLASQVRGPILKIDWPGGVRFLDETSVELTLEDRTLRIDARHLVLTAGAGNESILSRLESSGSLAGGKKPAMQRRSLHMVMVRGPRLPMLYGHCIGPSNIPRVTVTSQQSGLRFGRIDTVWYLGGAVAEQGVDRNEQEQIDATKTTLARCVPWIDWADSDLDWDTQRIDRAEGLTDSGRRPDLPVVRTVDNCTVAWPTKMVFAPRVAQEIEEIVAHRGIEPSGPIESIVNGWPRPRTADLPWQNIW